MDLNPFRIRLHDYLGLHGVKPNSSGLSTCPFHHHSNDTIPSFSIGGTLGSVTWHCFGCGESGDIFDFASIYYGLPKKGSPGFYHITLVHIANQLGIKYIPPKLTTKPGSNERMEFYSIMRFIISQLTIQPAVKYIKSRGWSQDTVKQFQLGVIKNADSLVSNLRHKYSNELLIKYGIVDKKSDRPHSLFATKRLLFPIFDEYGGPVGFTGRVMNDSDTKYKYVNTKGHSFFKKSSILYNFNRVKDRFDSVYIVEGQADVITMTQYGIPNVVAISGTSFSEAHIKLLSSMKRVTFVFDFDAAGVKGVGKALGKLPDAYVKLLPVGYDPDKFITENNGIKEFNELPFLSPLEFYIKTDSEVNRNVIAKKYLPLITDADPVDHGTLIKCLAEKTGYTRAQLGASLSKRLTNRAFDQIGSLKDKINVAYLTILPSVVDTK